MFLQGAVSGSSISASGLFALEFSFRTVHVHHMATHEAFLVGLMSALVTLKLFKIQLSCPVLFPHMMSQIAGGMSHKAAC